MQLKERIQQLAAENHEEIRAIRHHIHQHPELSFQEENTSAYVTSILDKWGIPYRKGWVKTGITATIEGKADGPTVALRADLDALPIVEQNEISYRSQNKGVMHACGHDVHTSCMLGAGKILQATADQWNGKVHLIFQPGEEKLPGGASLMIKEGLLDALKADRIIAQHVYPSLDQGLVGFRKGMYMASADEIYLTVKGKGGHGALPHQTIDAVLMASQIVVNLQQLVSRNAPSTIPSVLSFGKVSAEGATNVLPNEVRLEGTFRTMNEAWRAKAHERIHEIATATAHSFGGSCEVDLRKGYPFLTNEIATTMVAEEAARNYLGGEKVKELDIRMTAEDFSYYSQEIPACFYRLGVRNEALGITSGVHTPTFNIDEDALKTGSGLMAHIAIAQLEDLASGA